MSEASIRPAVKMVWSTRLWRLPFVRAVVGVVLTFVPLPLIMVLAQKLVAKPWRVVWPQLLAALLSFLMYRFFIRHVEKQAMTDFPARSAGSETTSGLALGLGLVASVFMVLSLFGVYTLEGVNQVGFNLLLPLAELLLVGLAEEMVFRGVIFRITEKSLGSCWAIVVSALLFALAHLPNKGISATAVAGVTAYGVMQAAIYLRTRHLWLCVGNHIAWNFSVGQIFSATVSGHGSHGGWLRGQLTGSNLLTGGDFGVEGSIITLLVISVAALYFLRSAWVQGHFIRYREAR